MGDAAIYFIILAVLAVVVGLPVWALVRTGRARRLEQRVAALESAVRRLTRELEARGALPATAERAAQAPEAPPVPLERPRRAPAPAPAAPAPGPRLEEVIGERWLAWVGIAVLLFGAAFALKYAFENRWIGETGRVLLGLLAGIGLLGLGWQRRRAGWHSLAQALTAGGVTLIYLAIYASYGFYQLIPAGAAFAILALVVLQTHLLAMAFDAPAIALMAQIGGFLTPVLLASDRDRYGILFSYLALLNAGAALVAIRRGWSSIASVSLGLTHILYWSWYAEQFHPEKLWAALLFHLVVFAIFLVVDLEPRRRGRPLTVQEGLRLFANGLLFYGAVYAALDWEHAAWQGAAALALAAVYALAARLALAWPETRRSAVPVAAAAALVFITLAIPIQLDANWITLAWAAQGAALAWLATRLGSGGLRAAALTALGLALLRYIVEDAGWGVRTGLTPIFNQSFLTALAVALGFAAAGWFFRRAALGPALAALLIAVGVVWLGATLDVYGYYDAAARVAAADDPARLRSLRWTAHAAASVLWSLFAAGLVAAGFRSGEAAVRWAGLALFGLTLAKVGLIDAWILRGIDRIVALICLGLVLLGSAWAYQRLRRGSTEAAT